MYSTLSHTPLYAEPSGQSFSFYEDDSAYWSFCSDYTELASEKVDLSATASAAAAAAAAEADLVNYPLTPETVSPSTSYDYDYCTIPAQAPQELALVAPTVAPMGTPQHTHAPMSAPVTPYYSMAPPLALYTAPASAPPSATTMHAPPPHPPVWTGEHFVPHAPVQPQPQLQAQVQVQVQSVPQPQPQAPTLGPASRSEATKSKTPENLAIKIQSMGFHHSFPSVRKCTSRALSLHMPLALLDQHRKAHIMHKAAEKGLNQDVVATHLEMFPDSDWSSDVPRELRVLPVISVDVGGTSVDAKSKHVKRPLNSFMIYRKAQTQRARANAAAQRQKINHQVISSIVGLLWQTEGSQVHDQFSDAAAVEKFIHSEQHPNYKFKPRKKAKATSPVKQADDSSEESA